MMTNRNKYDATFKLEVARMVVDQGLSVAQVAKEMNVGRTAVDRWSAQYKGITWRNWSRKTFDDRAAKDTSVGTRKSAATFG